MPEVDRSLVAWAESQLGGSVAEVRGLTRFGSPWLLEAGNLSAVMRVGSAENVAPLRVEAVALKLAADGGIAVPRIIAVDLESDPPVLLMTRMPGSSLIPETTPSTRLRTLGAVAARLHRITVLEDLELPHRQSPIDDVDFDQLRREAPRKALLERAEYVRDTMRPDYVDGFVHADLWQGNALWSGDALTALVDWEGAGHGAAGVDLGALRLDAAMCFGQAAAAEVLAGWEADAGSRADNIAYWDIVAGLSTPPDVGWFARTISSQGRPDLTRDLLKERRDTFIDAALDQLSSRL
jgi:aminoglycoside phosphotransferase (APT) family kinase protein